LKSILAVEAIPGFPFQARSARTTWGSPGNNYEITHFNIGYSRTYVFHIAGGLMSQQEGKFVIDRTFSIVEICVTYATGLDSNQYFSRPRIRD
tara:strand:+ start:277 stop:555 length:279 start_codon:yes stop_codon:yes gene_type:complete